MLEHQNYLSILQHIFPSHQLEAAAVVVDDAFDVVGGEGHGCALRGGCPPPAAESRVPRMAEGTGRCLGNCPPPPHPARVRRCTSGHGPDKALEVGPPYLLLILQGGRQRGI
eukprot:1194485-Prorocentrum_minimum.AAC.9